MAEEGTEMVIIAKTELRQLVEEAVRSALAAVERGPRRLLKTKEAAELMGVCPSTLRKMHSREGAPAVKMGSDLRWDWNKLVAWLEQGALEPGAHREHRAAQLGRMRSAGGQCDAA